MAFTLFQRVPVSAGSFLRIFVAGLVLFALLFLSGCAAIPRDFEQTPSVAWPAPEATALGQFFSEGAPVEVGRSGVRLLRPPREAFRARYALAARAERSLDLQYFLWEDDLTGNLLLLQALEAADRGVRVRLLLDDIYHRGRDQMYVELARHPNVEVRLFNPMGARWIGRNLNFVLRKKRLNHRMHNKIFLVDNAAVIIGGRNIGDAYFGTDHRFLFHDLDVLAVGPVAREAGNAFDAFWNSAASVPVEALRGRPATAAEQLRRRQALQRRLWEDDLPIPYALPRTPEAVALHLEKLRSGLIRAEAEIVVDQPDRFTHRQESVIFELMEGLKQGAETDLTLQSAYLIPAEETIQAYRELTDRGVRVRVLTNSLMSTNHVAVHGHYSRYRKALLRAGVELYELRADADLLNDYRDDSPLFNSRAALHTKAFVIDHAVSFIGSYNMDPRSRIWNTEIGLLVRGEAFASQVREVMQEEFSTGNSYRLVLNEDGGIEWLLDLEDRRRIYTREPEAGPGRRFLARLISWLPIEDEL